MRYIGTSEGRHTFSRNYQSILFHFFPIYWGISNTRQTTRFRPWPQKKWCQISDDVLLVGIEVAPSGAQFEKLKFSEKYETKITATIPSNIFFPIIFISKAVFGKLYERNKIQSNLDISNLMGLFFTSSNYPKCKLICTSGNLDL